LECTHTIAPSFWHDRVRNCHKFSILWIGVLISADQCYPFASFLLNFSRPAATCLVAM
jgi:hypothetical protein